MATLSVLPRRFDRIKKNIPREVGKIKKRVALKVLKTAVNGTPVDTSKALSNWTVGIGAAPSGVRGPAVPGKFGSTRSISAATTISTGEAVLGGGLLGSITVGSSGTSLGGSTGGPNLVGVNIHVTNNAPYIVGLNDGTRSNQAGAFKERALLAGSLAVKTFKIRL